MLIAMTKVVAIIFTLYSNKCCDWSSRLLHTAMNAMIGHLGRVR